MSTRSVTIVRQNEWYGSDDHCVEELFRFYRHCDGYPEGHGLQMAQAIIQSRSRTSNNRNWCQCVFGEVFNMDADLEVECKDATHGDLDYLYVVEGNCDCYGGKHDVTEHDVRLYVYRIGWDESYEYVMGSDSCKLFEGTADEYLTWIKERPVEW